MQHERAEKIRSSSLKRKENTLRNEYLHTMNNANEGTLKQELYKIFKDEVEIVNNNLL